MQSMTIGIGAHVYLEWGTFEHDCIVYSTYFIASGYTDD
jgi:hypothetical protein